MSIKKKIGIAAAAVLLVLLLSAGIIATKNPRVRLLLSVVHFSEKTLKSPSYLLYDVDIMELLREYANGDTAIEGRLSLSKMKDLNLSMYSNVSMKRSFRQKRLAAASSVEVLFGKVGDMELYAEEKIIYIVVPMLDDMAYAFPTDIDWFMKMPNLTSDLDREWFHENRKNIIDLMGELLLEETGETVTDADGTISSEFKITIPEGCGYFIWDLLGMDYPDYDVVVSMYLTPDNHMRRLVVDLEDVLPGAAITVDGEDVGTMFFSYGLPDDERLEVTMVRNSGHTNWMDLNCVYVTNTDTDYVFTAAMTWEKKEEGFDIRIRNAKVQYGSEVWARGSFKGTVFPCGELSDVFGAVTVDFSALEVIEWRELRDNTDEFVDDILEQVKQHTGLTFLQ